MFVFFSFLLKLGCFVQYINKREWGRIGFQNDFKGDSRFKIY